MKKIADIPLCDRPREKLVSQGPENLKDAELLAVILGSGYQGKNVVELAKSILRKIPKRKFPSLTCAELLDIKGISQAKAAAVLASVEFSKRALRVKSETRPVIKTVRDIMAQAVYLRDKTREHFMVIYLNARQEMISKKPMFVGTLNANLVHPREIFKEALAQNAAQIVLVHNHPSGHPEPSAEDIKITKNIQQAGCLMGIDVLDHVIVSRDKIFSFKRENLISK